MLRRRRTHVGAVAAATVLLLSGCGSATSDPTDGGGDVAGGEATDGGAATAGGEVSSGPAGPLNIGVTVHQADVYFQGVADAVTSAVEPEGGSMNLVNTQTDASTEATGFQDLISAQVDGIVTSPLSPEGSLASVQAAVDAGIPIVCYNTCLGDASEQVVAGFIESDQTDLGTQTGTYAAEYLQEQGITTAVLGMLNCNRYEACQDRQSGFLQALEDNGITVEVASDQEALAPDEAVQIATDILTANPDINVMWSASQGPTEGLVAAVVAGGRTDLALFGTDISPSLAQSIQSGDLLAVTGQDSGQTGELAVDYLRQAIDGEEVDPFSVQLPGILYSADDAQALEDYLSANG